VWTCISIALTFGACPVGPDQELTSTKPYADLIGVKYSVLTDDLTAYGVYESSSKKTIKFVDLVPLPIGGSEIAFKRRVPKGQIIRIISAWRRSTIFATRVWYRVAAENLDLPHDVPVVLELSRGNEGVGADLNPAIYRELGRDD
jgi:hypothetical protein